MDEFDTGRMITVVPKGQTHSLVREGAPTVGHKLSQTNAWLGLGARMDDVTDRIA
jgi:hypothetical protein